MRSNLVALPLLAIALTVSAGCTKKTEPPPVLSRIQEFSLTDQNGEAFERSTLDGSVWVADFVFTHCNSSCPRLTAHMQGLQTRVSDVPNVEFLSVSVDPMNDTPEVIKAYMADNELPEGNWRFVTGEEAVIVDVVRNGFKVGLAEGDTSAGAEKVMHSNHFVLLDKQGQVRGYYRANNDGIAELERDLRYVAANPMPVPPR
ncbi:MAG: SCO family protein [Myxococcota bacterium]